MWPWLMAGALGLLLLTDDEEHGGETSTESAPAPAERKPPILPEGARRENGRKPRTPMSAADRAAFKQRMIDGRARAAARKKQSPS